MFFGRFKGFIWFYSGFIWCLCCLLFLVIFCHFEPYYLAPFVFFLYFF